MKDDYDVGYGKPPKDGQFKKGQSGNPSGKKKPPKFEDLLKRGLAKERWVTVGGKKVKMSTEAVIVEVLLQKAANGDLPSIKAALGYALQVPEETFSETITDHQLAMLKDVLANVPEHSDEG